MVTEGAGRSPAPGDTVTVHYRALLDDAAKSGKTVRIGARIVQGYKGYNVAVERIDGSVYGRAEKGER